MLEELQAEAQEILDELWNEKLIPFELTIRSVTEGVGEYIIRFYDSRIHLVHVPLADGHPFKHQVRSAVLERVAKVSGRLHKSAETGSN
jgi:hypothetical protein